MLNAVHPGKITFSEMKFISTRFPMKTVQTVITEETMDALFDDVSSEIACFLGFRTVEVVHTLSV